MSGERRIVGIRLAAGRGERFGGDKLLAKAQSSAEGATPALDDLAGECIGVAACRHLIAALPKVIAVVRPDDHALAAALGAAGAQIVRCANAGDGMGASLACGVTAVRDAAGWVVALADMPWILPSTIARVTAAVADGAPVAAPFHGGKRGHPVGFSAACYEKLAALTGDEGAKSVVAAYADELAHIDVDDPGTLRDVDTPADLQK
ncbi:MAG TPA: nucleotidyltransferase family protein [Casimicrobiaceae bacterium]|nr:nucleotidyltransferase family protein [Casimicrobiaceae bacterium]